MNCECPHHVRSCLFVSEMQNFHIHIHNRATAIGVYIRICTLIPVPAITHACTPKSVTVEAFGVSTCASKCDGGYRGKCDAVRRGGREGVVSDITGSDEQ